jgi:hypothetical protein
VPPIGRGGNGWASRLNNAVIAHTARNASGTMNWMISIRMVGG